jgi:hypothetical protein
MVGPHGDETVEITLDQTRQLYFDLRALKALDRQMGEVGIAIVLERLRALNFSTLDRVIWAGLLHDEPTLTLNLVSKRIEKYVEEGGSTGPLFEAAYRAVDGSRVFGGPDRGNVKPEAVAES